jgi:hypothetical protein
VPHEIEDTVLIYIRPILDNYKEALNEGEFRMYPNGVNFGPGDLTECARTVVTSFARIQELGCIMIREDRKEGSMIDGRFQVSEYQIGFYKDYLLED